MERYPKYDFEIKKKGLFSFLRHSTDRIDKILDPWTSFLNNFASRVPADDSIYQKIYIFGERIDNGLCPVKLVSRNDVELTQSLRQLNTKIKVLIKYARSSKDYEALSGIDDIQDEFVILVNNYDFEKFGLSAISAEIDSIANVAQSFLVSLKEQICNYAADLREGFRRIIQFMFKNMDDESHSSKNSALTPTTESGISYCKFLNLNYESQGYTNRRKNYQLTC